MSRVLLQLELMVDEVLDPPVVTHLIEREQVQQAAAQEVLQAEKTTIATERDVFKAEPEALEAKNAEIQQQLEQLKASIEGKGLDAHTILDFRLPILD